MYACIYLRLLDYDSETAWCSEARPHPPPAASLRRKACLSEAAADMILFLPVARLQKKNFFLNHTVNWYLGRGAPISSVAYSHVSLFGFSPRGKRLRLLWRSTVSSQTSRRSQDTPPWSIPGTTPLTSNKKDTQELEL